ncbi:hypothetical protein OEZ85_004270 [Tetradesmus obliquus]|uniref:Sulfotransferase n=1 Tax=Tetradesmus obliquus TaxID=3088 RepID=A0ABY8UKT7_TETOB|nr:hypothetical protein OEZ85_004270 [Tetradesmus obliquus]
MTFPGSGNTWVRHIIETLTGYHTSSVYCDKFLQPVFKAECDDSFNWDKSIAVKTHMFSCWWKRAIVIIRHPLRAIMGDYQRLRTGRSHTGVVDPQQWNWDDWYGLSTRQCLRWTAQFQRIFGTATSPGCGNATEFKVFFYEDLKTASGELNPYFLEELLDWFGIPKDDSFFECALMNNKGSFARKLPSNHPATKILNDTETHRRMTEAGCLQAYDYLSSKFPHLKQPQQQQQQQTASSSAGSQAQQPLPGAQQQLIRQLPQPCSKQQLAWPKGACGAATSGCLAGSLVFPNVLAVVCASVDVHEAAGPAGPDQCKTMQLCTSCMISNA